MTLRNPKAFTLLELLIVITIVMLLIALLLPAVQAAREAARRASCANNVRQISLAVLQHHEAIGYFPAGNFASRAGVCTGANQTTAAQPSQDHANWAILILPFLEENAVYSQYDFSTYNEAPENRAVREASISVYHCPSDRQSSELTVPGMGPAASWDLDVPYRPGSYRAVSGRSDGREFLDHPLVMNYPRRWRGAMHLIGILGFQRERLRNVKDGASHTFLIGESASRSRLDYRTLWAYSYGFYSLSSTIPQSRTLWGDYERCRAASGIGYGSACARGWGSYHYGGSWFGLCDGAVRFVSEDVDPNLFAAAGSIAGSETEVWRD